MSKERIALSWSGGKDSTLALQELLSGKKYDIPTVQVPYDRLTIRATRVH